MKTFTITSQKHWPCEDIIEKNWVLINQEAQNQQVVSDPTYVGSEVQERYVDYESCEWVSECSWSAVNNGVKFNDEVHVLVVGCFVGLVETCMRVCDRFYSWRYGEFGVRQNLVLNEKM